MQNLQLPPELKRLERFLTRGPRPVPSAALRQRVFSNVRSELRSKRISSRWRFGVALAASLLVWLGLSLGAMQATVFALQHHEVSPSVFEVARRLQQLSPNLSREESLRQAVLRNIGAEVNCTTPLGDIPSVQECHDP